MAKKCPVCGHFAYEEWKGEYGKGKRLTSGSCSYCGFIYEENPWESLEDQVESYKEHLMKKGIEYHRKELYKGD